MTFCAGLIMQGFVSQRWDTGITNSRMILDGLKITDLFDAIIDGTKVSRAKPDPEVFLAGARELGLPPAECVVFEDAAAEHFPYKEYENSAITAVVESLILHATAESYAQDGGSDGRSDLTAENFPSGIPHRTETQGRAGSGRSPMPRRRFQRRLPEFWKDRRTAGN